jgi:hypothetical protein
MEFAMETEKKPAEGLGFVTTCARCGYTRLVRRAEIMAGTWLQCPACEERDKED